MNILQVISKNDRYGAQRVFIDQAAALQRLGHRVVVVGRGEGYVSESVRAMGGEYHGIPMKSAGDVLHMARLVKKSGIDIIHTYLDRADYFGIIVSRLARKPVVSTMNVRRYHIGYKFVDGIAVVSKIQKELLVSKGVPSGKIRVVRPGIETGRYREPDREKREDWKQRLRLWQFSIVFCHISSMLSQKSHKTSLKLVSECRRRGERPLLIVAGDPLRGEYYESLVREISDSGLAGNVHFTGWTSELPELLSLSHFTLLPSVREAFGMVLVEGMAAGAPIVAREGEGGAELVEEYGTGFLYRPGAGIPALAEDILSLWRDPAKYQGLSALCRSVAQDHFSLESFGDRLVSLYGSVLG